MTGPKGQNLKFKNLRFFGVREILRVVIRPSNQHKFGVYMWSGPKKNVGPKCTWDRKRPGPK